MRRSPSKRVRALLVPSVLGWVLGCQQVFGDFEVTPSPEPPPAETGGNGGSSSTGGQASGPETCLAHEQFCDGAVLHQCVEGLWQRTTCASDAHCDVSTGRCRSCVLGESKCLDDKTPQICDSGNDIWITSSPCDVGQTCDEVRGACVACEPEFGVCVGQNVVCRCKADQSGFEALTCPNGCAMMGSEDRCAGGEGVAGGPAGACDNI